MKNPIHKTSLRTDMSLWLDQTDVLKRRLEESDGTKCADALVENLTRVQIALSEYFAEQAKGTPGRYRAKLGQVL